jgi:endonuclease/exonuclease/phosphatase (EEP) superfamily protein YafD
MAKKSNKMLKVCIFGIRLILAGLAFAAMIILFKLRLWPFELFHHFVWHYFLLTFFLIVACLFIRAKMEVALFSSLLLVFGISLWGAYGTPRVSQDSITTLPDNYQEEFVPFTLISHNIRDSNKHHQKLGLWIKSQPADVVVLQEVPSRIAAWYKEERFYPYQLEVYDPALNHPNFPDDKAIVILSKYFVSGSLDFKPFKDSRPVPLVRIDVPNAQGFCLAIIDALEPKTAEQLGRRDQLLLKSAKMIGEQNGPVVVAGDFNATPLTPIFKDFLKMADLSASRFYSPTFPSKLNWLGIPIDHILVRNIKVKRIEALPAMGSDHRPLKAELLIPRSPRL